VVGVGKLLSRARRPVLILGSQINWSSYKRRLLEFVEKLGLPVYLIGMARGGLGRNHPLLFTFSRKKALKIADLVIVAGVSFDFRLNYGNAISGRAEVVRVDLNKDDLYKNRRARIGICGDSGEFLMRLSEIFQENQSWSEWLFHLRRLEEEAFEEKDLAFQSFSDEVPINPVRLCREVEDTLGEKSIIIGDGGDIVGTASYIVKPRFLGGWLDAGPYGTLGAGAGFALAAKLVYPDYDVGVIWGDSALSYSIIEYSTFAKRGIAILGVVGNNGVNAQIQRNDLKILGETVATELPYDRYDLAVQAFGNSLGIWVTDPSELKVSLERGLAASRAGRPVLINVEIGTSDFRKDSLAM
jgi:acetolactate synthase-1/2/3 large subunit